MTIDPKTLPLDARVEATANHFPDDFTHFTTAKDVRTRGDLSIVRVFVPVPDGVAYDDALRAVNERPWVPLPDGIRHGEYEGARLRAVGNEHKCVAVSGPLAWETGDSALVGGSRVNVRAGWLWFIHPDDVPDPDAAVKDRLRYLLEQSYASMDALVDDVLAVIREDGAK